MKLHIGADKRGIVHTVTATPAGAADISQLPALLHGQEREIFGDQAYWKVADRQAFTARGIHYRLNRRVTGRTSPWRGATRAGVGTDWPAQTLANVIQFAPPQMLTDAGSFFIGRVVSSRNLVSGVEMIQSLDASEVKTEITFPHDGVMRYEVVDWLSRGWLATAVAAASDNQEHFYGFGEKFKSLDQAGEHVRMLTFDEPGNKGDHSYKVAPWFISTRGYGVHLDSTAESTFDIRAGAADRYVIANPVGELGLNVVYGPMLHGASLSQVIIAQSRNVTTASNHRSSPDNRRHSASYSL